VNKFRYALILVLALFAATVGIGGCAHPLFQPREKLLENERKLSQAAEQEIKGSARLKEVDALCRQVPLPQGFSFISKHVNNDATVSFNYGSEVSFVIARKFYLDYFENNGWTTGIVEAAIVHRVNAAKDGNRIMISYGGVGSSEIDYSITCGKTQ
jgi:hypothetical protein